MRLLKSLGEFAGDLAGGLIGAIANGDSEKAIKVGKELAKTACVGVFAIGLCDLVDGVIDIDVDDMDEHVVASGYLVAQDMDDYELVENVDVHHVQPFERQLADGSVIWVDGDGDTSVDTFDGWVQSNPDYRG